MDLNNLIFNYFLIIEIGGSSFLWIVNFFMEFMETIFGNYLYDQRIITVTVFYNFLRV